MKSKHKKKRLIYDVLYGFIRLTPIEWEIIHTPFYQRLKWIKQLGFSFYTYPGAEHSRFGHSLGVMNNADCILRQIGEGADEEELYSGVLKTKEAKEHQSIRIAALLHDIGTFCFSHTIENAYIKYSESSNQKKREQRDDHEHLGSFIIKRTDTRGGITRILKENNLDVQKISDLVKGIDSNILANQVLHSEVDCDRMDYLLRDAHYTGLQYGKYDRAYLLNHFQVREVSGNKILTIHEKAINCVQDFLISRFAWYSQVVRSGRGAKFDALAEEVAFYMLKNGLIYKYGELLELIEHEPSKFFTYNDSYFMNVLQEHYHKGTFAKEPRILDMVESLLFSRSPIRIKHEAFKQRILDQNNMNENQKIMKRAKDKFQEIYDYVKKHGDETCWMIEDFPKKDIYLAKSHKRLVKDTSQTNLLLERDPVKICYSSGEVYLLSNLDNNLVSKLQNSVNFMPHVFCNEKAYACLKDSGLIER